MKKTTATLIAVGALALCAPAQTSRLLTFDQAVVDSTFKIQVGGTLGTAFVLLQPVTNSPLLSYVLVTAAHVLDTAPPSSNAVLLLRAALTNRFVKVPYAFPIRAYNTNLWVRHPDADVAAMRVPLPPELKIGGISTDLLATDETLAQFLLHPGDELRVLGYPYGFEASEAGFPILRSGRVASFPLLPTAVTKTFLLDFRVFRGNSGGPVYIIDQRQFTEGSITTVNVTMLVGLLSQEATISEQVTGLTETTTRTHDLGLGRVVHASLIKETISLLPPVPAP